MNVGVEFRRVILSHTPFTQTVDAVCSLPDLQVLQRPRHLARLWPPGYFLIFLPRHCPPPPPTPPRPLPVITNDCTVYFAGDINLLLCVQLDQNTIIRIYGFNLFQGLHLSASHIFTAFIG